MRVWLKSILVIGAIGLGIIGCAAQPVAPPASPAVDAPARQATPTVVSAPVTPKPTVDKDDVFLWGTEVTLDEFIAICKSGKVDRIEWFMEQDRLRLFTKQGERYNYRNEKTRLDMAKVLQAQGLDVSENGVNLYYED